MKRLLTSVLLGGLLSLASCQDPVHHTLYISICPAGEECMPTTCDIVLHGDDMDVRRCSFDIDGLDVLISPIPRND